MVIDMKKRLGLYFLIFLVLAGFGALTGCTSKEKSEEHSALSSDSGDTEETFSEMPAEESEDKQMTAPGETTSEGTEAAPSRNNDTEISLSADAIEVKEISEKIFAAYFKGDWEVMNEYSLDSTADMIDMYPNAAKDAAIPECTIKGLSEINDAHIGESYSIWCEFLESPEDDFYQYLTIIFMKTEEGWKVTSTGLEM